MGLIAWLQADRWCRCDSVFCLFLVISVLTFTGENFSLALICFYDLRWSLFAFALCRVERSEIDVAGGLYVLFGSGSPYPYPAFVCLGACLSTEDFSVQHSVFLEVAFNLWCTSMSLQGCALVFCRICIISSHCSLYPPIVKGKISQVRLHALMSVSHFLDVHLLACRNAGHFHIYF